MATVISLSSNEDISLVRSRIQLAPEKTVLVVAPDDQGGLRDQVKLRLLRRYSESLAVRIGVVTNDPETATLARSVGLSVFKTVAAGESAHWKQQIFNPGFKRRFRPQDIVKRVGHHRGLARTRRRSGIILTIFSTLVGTILVLAGFGAIGAILWIPEAQVTLVPATEPVEQEFTVRAVAKSEIGNIQTATVSEDTGPQVPARYLEESVQRTAQAPTTARKDVPDAPAKGRVTFINKFATEVTVPSGSLVRTSSGSRIRFRTLHDVVLPATIGATDDVDIEAIDPGPAGNLPAYAVNSVDGSLASAINVVNKIPTQGGNVTSVGVVTEDSRVQLREFLLKVLQNEAMSRLRGELKPDEFLDPAAINVLIMSERYGQGALDQSDTLNLTLNLLAKGYAVSDDDLKQVAEKQLSSVLEENFYIVPESVQVERLRVQTLPTDTVLLINLKASGIQRAKVDPTIVRSSLVGIPLEAVQHLLETNIPLKRPPVIQTKPDWSWWSRMPLSPFRIDVQVSEE
ncbi:MAG: baseplate J/gp47 family protein [Chloroflexi bacterium]|nr:baseplate J/gp47 family protein [Chloroflexota bacterium]